MRRVCGRLQGASGHPQGMPLRNFGHPQGDAPTQFWPLMQHRRRAQEQVIMGNLWVIYNIHDPNQRACFKTFKFVQYIGANDYLPYDTCKCYFRGANDYSPYDTCKGYGVGANNYSPLLDQYKEIFVKAFTVTSPRP